MEVNRKNMRLVLRTLLGFFVSNCCAQDLSLYSNLNRSENVKTSKVENFTVTDVTDYFYTVNSKSEKELIAHYRENLYKFNDDGDLVDTLNLSDTGVLMYNIHPENYFIFTENGYYRDWIKTGDKTKRTYDKVYNQNLTMDVEALKKYKEDLLNFEYKDPSKSSLQEYYDYLDEKAVNFEVLKLIKTLDAEADYRLSPYFSSLYLSIIFIVGNEVIKVNLAQELDYFKNKIMREKRLEAIVAEFTEEQKCFRFEKKEWVKRNWNILSTNHGGYWLGTAYYNLKVGEDILKMKVELVNKRSKNIIKINRTIFSDNKHFILAKTVDGSYFVKENLRH